MKIQRSWRATSASSLILVALGTGMAHAADQGETAPAAVSADMADSGGLTEIVVTAQRLARRARRTPHDTQQEARHG